MTKQQKTLLIIEDEIHLLEILTSFFIDEGYLVFSAEDGKSGLDIFFKEEIDLVLTDLKMPKMNGIEVMKTIHESSPDTPMIVVSGTGRRQDIITALRMGAKDYISKPIEDLEMINHTIKQALENKRLNEENRLYREKLEKSEHRHRTITENIAEGVVTVDEFENITYTNQAFSDMIGYSIDELQTKNLKDLSTKDNFDIIQEQTQNRRAGLIDRYEIQLLDNHMKPVDVEVACSPILGDTDKYKGGIAVVRDITKTMALKKKLQKFLTIEDSSSKDLVPICASCKNIKMKNEVWVPVEEYFMEILFSHGVCPSCCEKLYPELNLSDIV